MIKLMIRGQAGLFLLSFFAGIFVISSADLFAGTCDEYQSHLMVEKCYGKVAAEKNDISLCDQFPTGHCHAAFAVAKGDPLACEKLTFQQTRDFCYFDIAVEVKKQGFCDRISVSDTKSLCYVLVDPVQNSAHCDDINYQRSRETCYQEVALARNDLSFCKKIKIQDVRDKCFYEWSLAKRDSKVCSQIRDERMRSACPKEIKIRLDNPEAYK